MVLNTYLPAVYRGLHHFDFVNAVLVGASVLYPVSLLVLWQSRLVSTPAFALSSLLIQWLVAAAYLWRLMRPALRGAIEWALYGRILLQGCRLFMPVIVLTVYTLADRALLIRFGTVIDLGHYAVSYAVSFPVAMAAEAFAQLGFIEMAEANGQRAAGALMARRFQMAQIVVALAIATLVPLSYFLVRYGFGPTFLPALSSTRLMIVAMALRGLSKALEHAARANNVVMPGILSSGVALSGLIGMAWILVPTRGILGLAQALLVGEIGCLLVLVLLVKRRFRLRCRDLWGLTPSMFRVLAGHAIRSMPGKRRVIQ
jgi:O-antigen/teichoic acid export membrane protein